MFEFNAFNIAPWGHELVIYFWLIGTIGMTYILASVPVLTTGTSEAFAKVQKPAYILAFIALLVCGVLLITDLGQPQRFMNILIYHHMSSPLVWGSILLLGFGACMALVLFSLFIKSDENLLRWAALIGSILAVGLPLYTGLDQAGNQGRVLWHDPMIPLLYTSLSVTSGAAVLAAIGLVMGEGGNTGLYALLRRVLFWSLLATTVMFVLMLVRLNYGTAQEQQVMGIINSEMGFEFWVMTLLVGILVPLALVFIRGIRDQAVVVTVAGILGLVGAYTFRAVIMYGGQLPQLYY